MMITVKTKVKKDFRRSAKRMVKDVEGEQMTAILVEAMEPMREETRHNARYLRDTSNPNPKGGHLDEGVVVGKGRATKRKKFAVLGFINRAKKIAHLVEFGTAPHDQPKRRMVHPGAAPRPFFRPAYEATKGRVLSTVTARAWHMIKRSGLSGV